MKKMLIVYDSRTGRTQRMAERIAEGVRSAGNEAYCAGFLKSRATVTWKDTKDMSSAHPRISRIRPMR